LKSKYSSAWLSHLTPLLTALLAVIMLVLTPVWAYNWFQLPFPGMMIEQNNVISILNGKDWPARNLGVAWSDRLMSVNGQSVDTTARLGNLLKEAGFTNLNLEFEKTNHFRFSIQIVPIKISLVDQFTLFFIPYLAGVTFLIIGLWAYRLRGELRASRAFLIFSGSVSILTTTFFDMNSSHHVVAIWTASLFIASAALVHLALVFPQQMPFVDRWPISRFIPWVAILPWVVPAVREIFRPTDPYRYIQVWQSGYVVVAVSMLFFLATLVTRIVRSHSAIIRQQSRVIVFGAGVAFTPMLVLYLIPTVFSNTPAVFRTSIYFPLLVLLPLSVMYAILRYRLLDVDLFFSRVLAYILTMLLAFAAFYGLLELISLIIRQNIEPDNPMVVSFYLLALAAGLMPLRNFVQRVIERLFYRSPADYHRVLNELSSSLVITPDLQKTLSLLNEKIQQALSPEDFAIYLFDDDLDVYLPHTFSVEQKPWLQVGDALIGLISNMQAATWLPPNRELPVELAAETGFFEQFHYRTFVPLRYESRLIGFMALGLRRSGEPYTSDDLEFLNTVAGQSTLALENARLFNNLQRTYEQTLEMKNLMDDIFASIATGVITTDMGSKITLFNRAAEQILGVPGLDVVGKSLLDALPDLDPDLSLVTSSVLTHGSSILSTEISPHVQTRGDLFLRFSCSPLRDAYLETKGATIVIDDLTERKNLMAEQERIRKTFGRVVSPRVRDRLLSDARNLQLDGVRQKTTILFADLSGFTHFSEITDPETLFKLLNRYLSLAAQTILDEEGTLDKFMGDAVMALWNTPDPQPDHSLRAVRAALKILERTKEVHRSFPDPVHHLQFRVGITSGDAMVGNVGTSELFNYTAIGGTVNLAQRLEVTAKPGQVLIDEVVYETLSDQIDAVSWGPVELKGFSKPMKIYELKGLK
jgi:PAS domain S-box-containing protein